MFVEDACEGIRILGEIGIINQIYNLGTFYEESIATLMFNIHKLVAEMSGTMSTELRMIRIPDRPFNDRRYLIDSSKIMVGLLFCRFKYVVF